MRRQLATLLGALLVVGLAGCPDDEEPPADTAGDAAARDVVDADDEPDPGDVGVDGGDRAGDTSDREPSDVDPTWDFGTPDPDGSDSSDEFAIREVVPPRGPLAGGNRIRVVGSGFSDETELYFGGREVEASYSGGALVGEAPEGPRPGGVTVKAVGADGESDSISDGYTYVEGVSVASITPTALPTEGGALVTIRGSGFTDPTAVSFDGEVARHVERVSDDLLRVVAPSGSPGPADLRVTTDHESHTVDEAVTYIRPLEVRSVQPASGSTSGGSVADVHVEGLGRSASVSFGGREADVREVEPADDLVEVEVPPHVEGLVDVAVESRDDSAIASEAFWYHDGTDPALAAAKPAKGSAAGGTEVTLIGSGLDVDGLAVEFGGEEATVVESGPTRVTVETPEHEVETVDVTVKSDGSVVARGTELFEYRRPLWIDDISPANGSHEGGTEVVLEGEGFEDVERVRFGGLPAEIVDETSTELNVVTPAHSAGTVDVVVERQGLEARLKEGFTYEAPVEVWGFSPTRGSVAGDTYVEIRGRGFTGQLDVEFDGNSAREVRRLDANNLYVYTPAHPPGHATVEVEAGNGTASAPYPFEYFNPTSRQGGASGGPVDGAVNVSVMSRGGGAVPGAFVMLSTRSDSSYTGTTDESGRVTLSGPDVNGPQTVTATAKGYSSATVQEVDAENITVFLRKMQASNGGGGGGGGPPSATIHGEVSAPVKRKDPGEAIDYDVAVVRTTQQEIGRPGLAPGPGSVVVGEGEYSIKSRIGDVAVIAMCGQRDDQTDEFVPEFLGVERYVNLSDGEKRQIDLTCNIPLEESLEVKLRNPIFAPRGPNTNVVRVYWDFGFEGVFQSPTVARGAGELLTVEKQPPLEGPLSDVTMTVNGGSFTGTSSPSSQTNLDGVADLESTVVMPPLVEVPEPVAPEAGGELDGNEIRFQAAGPFYPDFYSVFLLNKKGRPFWHYVLPGDATALRFPELPDLSFMPEDQRPEPMAEGQAYVLFMGVDTGDETTVDSYSYDDLSSGGWRGYSLTRWGFVIPSQ